MLQRNKITKCCINLTSEVLQCCKLRISLWGKISSEAAQWKFLISNNCKCITSEVLVTLYQEIAIKKIELAITSFLPAKFCRSWHLARTLLLERKNRNTYNDKKTCTYLCYNGMTDLDIINKCLSISNHNE